MPDRESGSISVGDVCGSYCSVYRAEHLLTEKAQQQWRKGGHRRGKPQPLRRKWVTAPISKAAMAKRLRGFVVGNPVFKCKADSDGSAMGRQFDM